MLDSLSWWGKLRCPCQGGTAGPEQGFGNFWELLLQSILGTGLHPPSPQHQHLMVFFLLSDIWDHQKVTPRKLCPPEKPPMAEASPERWGSAPFPGFGAHCTGICAHRSHQGWGTFPWLSSPTGTRALTPTAEISPRLKQGTRTLLPFFGLLDFQLQPWTCAQCDFSIRKL